jgi:protein-disulfide isomerase
MSGRTRRDLLAAAGCGLAVGLAGCSGSGGDGGSGSTSTRAADGGDTTGTGTDGDSGAGSMTDGSTTTGTGTGTPTESESGSGSGSGSGAGRVSGVTAADFGDHAAAQGIEGQPVMGDPATAPTTVIAFEDPSCPTCASFERRTGSRIREELVPSGQTAFVMRTIPVIYPWGRTAVPALEATFARDADAFWTLLDYYFGTQGSFDTDNVLERTREFLQSATSVDVDGVIADVESDAVQPAIDADLAAADAAGVRGTPTIFMFRDGEYQTNASGPVSFDVVTRVLGV